LLLSTAKAIDEYANLKTKAAESNDEASKVDPRLEAIVERMLDKYETSTLLIKYLNVTPQIFIL
jgi:hypothetical protein